jgi:hypothetical protein
MRLMHHDNRVPGGLNWIGVQAGEALVFGFETSDPGFRRHIAN